MLFIVVIIVVAAMLIFLFSSDSYNKERKDFSDWYRERRSRRGQFRD